PGLSISPTPVRRFHDRREPTRSEESTMRFMMLIKSDANAEAGVLPSEALIAAMGRYNDELVKAGVLLAAEGLHASAKGARIQFSRGARKVIDGPFAEAKELIAGFWMIQVKSRDEAV